MVLIFPTAIFWFWRCYSHFFWIISLCWGRSVLATRACFCLILQDLHSTNSTSSLCTFPFSSYFSSLQSASLSYSEGGARSKGGAGGGSAGSTSYPICVSIMRSVHSMLLWSISQPLSQPHPRRAHTHTHNELAVWAPVHRHLLSFQTVDVECEESHKQAVQYRSIIVHMVFISFF